MASAMSVKNSICFFSGIFACFKCFFLVFKQSKVNVFSGDRDVGLPFLGLLMPRNPRKPGLIVSGLASVFAIILTGNLPQINNAIIVSFPINMINFFCRPFSKAHCPSNPVCWNNNSAYAYFDVSVASCSSDASGFRPSRAILPPKNSAVAVIGKTFVKDVDGNLSHDEGISPILNGGKYGVFG